MTRHLAPRITEFFTDHPHGAPVWQVAEYLGSSNDTTIIALRRMADRGDALMTLDSSIPSHTVWALSIKETPPIFRAMETLRAMQAVARDLLSTNEVAYAS
jgi:hypothetical protein